MFLKKTEISVKKFRKAKEEPELRVQAPPVNNIQKKYDFKMSALLLKRSKTS